MDDERSLTYYLDTSVIDRIYRDPKWDDSALDAILHVARFRFSALNIVELCATPNPDKRVAYMRILRKLSENFNPLALPSDNETLSEAGQVSRDECFDRAAYFLKRVIPVAEANNVQLASHLDDPPAPVLRGVERWNWPVFDGLKRFSELVDSPNHGFKFCCGVASEGLENPGEDLYEIIRYFGERNKLFNIHFRNIKGGLHNFQEVWPDEGDLDMHKIAQTLRDVEYPYMLMPDHAPGHPDDVSPEGVSGRVSQAWAFQFGYIIAMIQSVNAEGA